MNLKLYKYLLLIILITISGCNYINIFDDIELPVIKNATTLGGGSNFLQKNLSLLIFEEYPNYEAMNFYDNYFSKNGWITCKNSNDWYSYVDLSSSKKVRKFQKINYYANFDKNILGTIFLIYISDMIKNENLPDNNEQYIHIMLEYSFNINRDFKNICNR